MFFFFSFFFPRAVIVALRDRVYPGCYLILARLSPPEKRIARAEQMLAR